MLQGRAAWTWSGTTSSQHAARLTQQGEASQLRASGVCTFSSRPSLCKPGSFYQRNAAKTSQKPTVLVFKAVWHRWVMLGSSSPAAAHAVSLIKEDKEGRNISLLSLITCMRLNGLESKMPDRCHGGGAAIRFYACAEMFKYTLKWWSLSQTGCFVWIRMRDARSTVGRTLCLWRRFPPGDRNVSWVGTLETVSTTSCYPFFLGVMPIKMILKLTLELTI